MATIPLTITGATAPYNISVKKQGDNTERFISYNGTILTFNGSTENALVTYTIYLTDANQCPAQKNFNLLCGGGSNIEICNSNLTSGGIGGTKTYNYTNNTGSPIDIYWEWDTSNFPDLLQVFVDNVIWHDTHCAGPLPNTCNPPGDCQYQSAITYGKLTLPNTSSIRFYINGDCGNSEETGTVWSFKTRCIPFSTSPVVYTGTPAPCNIQITQTTITGDGIHTIYLDRWTGGLSGQYEFGIQPESSANIGTVNWIRDNTVEPGAGMLFTNLTPGTNYRLWIRDKNNTSCNSYINRTAV